MASVDRSLEMSSAGNGLDNGRSPALHPFEFLVLRVPRVLGLDIPCGLDCGLEELRNGCRFWVRLVDLLCPRDGDEVVGSGFCVFAFISWILALRRRGEVVEDVVGLAEAELLDRRGFCTLPLRTLLLAWLRAGLDRVLFFVDRV